VRIGLGENCMMKHNLNSYYWLCSGQHNLNILGLGENCIMKQDIFFFFANIMKQDLNLMLH
jgi:hypothetical protein